MPKQLAQVAYRILVASDCIPRPWQLLGRYGSRTHPYQNDKVGIPILSQNILHRQMDLYPELRVLVETDGVEAIYKPYHPLNRNLAPPPIDACIHPELAPPVTTTYDYTHCSKMQRQKIMSSMKNTEFTYAELFAGVGGFGVALEALGGRCVFCSEILESCRQVYQLNFPNTSTNHLHGDIYAVKDEDLPRTRLDLLVGGFPCQPFSALGEQPGLDVADGNLFLEIVRVLRVSQPSAFLLENVPGLLEMKDTFNTIVHALQDVGYTVTTEVCNARCLTAQSRKRLFFVGLRKKTSSKTFHFPYVPDLHLRARDVIAFGDETADYKRNQDDDGEHIHDILHPDFSSSVDSTLLYLTDDQLEHLKGTGRWKPSDLAWPDVVCQTLVSHYGNSVTRGRHTTQLVATDRNPRRMTVRECASLMGFPRRFRIPSRTASTHSTDQGDMAWMKEQYRMFGNAVCPPLIAAIAGPILQHIHPSILENDDSDCSCKSRKQVDWIECGRVVAVQLAYDATRSHDVDAF